MRQCIFCGRRAGSLEHIIAQRLIRRMGADNFSIIVALRQEDEVKQRPAHDLYSYTTRVCKTCNETWMNDLESWLEGKMGVLIEPTWPSMAHEFLRLALEQNDRFARWALKTAITADSNSMAKNVIDQITAHTLYNGTVPDGIIVEIGYIHEPGVGVIISQGFPVWNGNQNVQWQEHRDKMAFKAVLLLNHLAIRIFRAPKARAIYSAPSARLPLRCYPSAQDPYSVDFRFHDLAEFDHALELATDAGMA